MTLVYRIAKKDSFSEGLYTSNVSCNLFDLGGCHPEPRKDTGIAAIWKELGTELLFGFGSISQLMQWVHKEEWRKGLDLEGYIIYVVKPLGAYAIGETQAVFRIREYEILNTISLDTL